VYYSYFRQTQAENESMSAINGHQGANIEVFSVSELNRLAKGILEHELPLVYVEGEISNFAKPASGHWYFTLKDSKAQLRSAMFRNRNQRVRFTPRNGLQVLVRGKISLYEARGEYQFIAEQMEEAGEGALRRAFDELRMRLQQEGLFANELKKPIPKLANHLAIITSPTGAAIRDVLSVVNRRFPSLACTVIPTQVQGEESIGQVVSAIQQANLFTTDPFDLILITRGGGSLEDLWTFNTEPVARAIAASKIPIISAVGHESDVSIADFAADLRAPTPSAAAELIAPDQHEWALTFDRVESQLITSLQNEIEFRKLSVDALKNRLRNPLQILTELKNRLIQLQRSLESHIKRALQGPDLEIMEKHLIRAMSQLLDQFRHRTLHIEQNLQSPLQEINSMLSRQQHLNGELAQAMNTKLANHKSTLALAAGKLNALSPLSTLDRGYAIVRDAGGSVITNAVQTQPGQHITVRFAENQITAEVIESAANKK
jgi:exodeoxyribonuclease VII large subunit